MGPEEFKACREAVGLNLAEWAIALGYRLKDRDSLRSQAYAMETGRKSITQQTARLAEMFRRFGVPEEFLFRSTGSEPDQKTEVVSIHTPVKGATSA